MTLWNCAKHSKRCCCFISNDLLKSILLFPFHFFSFFIFLNYYVSMFIITHITYEYLIEIFVVLVKHCWCLYAFQLNIWHSCSVFWNSFAADVGCKYETWNLYLRFLQIYIDRGKKIFLFFFVNCLVKSRQYTWSNIVFYKWKFYLFCKNALNKTIARFLFWILFIFFQQYLVYFFNLNNECSYAI